MQKDSGVHLQLLKVDGGMTANNLLMQFQADLLDVPVLTPQTFETTSLGAASAAGLAVGFWKNFEELREIWSVGSKWDPYMPRKTREELIRGWSKAVTKSFGWLEKSLDDKAGTKGSSKKAKRAAEPSLFNEGEESDDDGDLGLGPTWMVGLACLAIGFIVGTRWRK